MTEIPALEVTDLHVPDRDDEGVTRFCRKDIATVLHSAAAGRAGIRMRPGGPRNAVALVDRVRRADAVAFIGDGLRDALDPNSSGAKARAPRKPKSTAKEGRTS